ncbi:uncharacterized protein LOC106067181 isoform X2 [Biomphalaria glabrata]|uniref:Uncharacterized protein LOC106067181 isoform X2 n=1 Tax=Biomphalaria glabrata TaxID=6526 RepID=A0A9W2YXT1_BIOGL|nr:uncharacterized protein LOC106067181 isoform X2 [Biomphalaria glabrata]
MCVSVTHHFSKEKINLNYLKAHSNSSGTSDVHVIGGLWWYCYADPITGNTCDIYPLGGEEGAIWAVRLFVFLNVLLSVFCCLTVFFRICFQGVGRTICQGITAFVTGCCGFVVVGLFVYLFDNGYSLPLKGVVFSWVFYIYIIGCALVTVAAGFLCLVVP